MSVKQEDRLEKIAPRKRGGMTEAEANYMRGDKKPHAGSIPHTTSKFLNSPLFVHAFSVHALRRMGDDIATTYDMPTMSRALDDVADFEEAQAAIDEEKAKNPVFARWIERKRLTQYTPELLAQYPDGTLGGEIRAFIERTGYDITFINKGVEPRNDIEYLMVRNGSSHDIQHLATGFGPHGMGEHALAMMNVAGNAKHFNAKLARFVSMPNVFVTSCAYTRVALHYHDALPLQLEANMKGVQAGLALTLPLIMVEWEDYLDWELDAIAADLGFVRGPGDAWLEHTMRFRG